jgi:hypothetical protein
MFQGLLMRAERSIDQVIAKYMGRAMVAVPLLVATGFATAALTVELVELYGSVTAYGVMAAVFGVIGLATMAIVNVGSNHATEAPTADAEMAASPEQPQEARVDTADLLTPELRALLASAAPMALPPVFRGIGKNLPLILVLALVGFIISRFAEGSESAGDKPDGTHSDTPDIDPAQVAAASAAAAAAAA